MTEARNRTATPAAGLNGDWLTKERLHNLLNVRKPSEDDAVSTVYLQPGEVAESPEWRERLARLGKTPEESGCGLVCFRGGDRALVMAPPFPVTESSRSDTWNEGPLWSLLDAHRTVGVVLVRLGRYSVALTSPEVLREVASETGISVDVLDAAVDVTASQEAGNLAVRATLPSTDDALLVARALTDDRRRRVAWAGGMLLAAATWVRLADIGVEAPEAYTATTALALLVVGLRALRRAPERGSVATLLPGLVLAVLPSLLWVLAQDPVSWRALLLGLGCLVLVLGGARLGWQAPLLVGTVAGGLLVLWLLGWGTAVATWLAPGALGCLAASVPGASDGS
mgnify:CR=1 FL=1